MDITRGEMRGLLALAAILLAISLVLFLTRSCEGFADTSSDVIETLRSDVSARAEADSLSACDTISRSDLPGDTRKRPKKHSTNSRKTKSYSDRPSPLDPGQEVPASSE